MPTPTTLRRTAFSLSTLSLLPHIFCCLLPTVAALISLGTTAGLATAMASNPLYRLVDTYHPYFLLLAVLATTASGLITYASWRIDCLADVHPHTHAQYHVRPCHHEPHAHARKKSRATRLFFFSLGLLALDIAWFCTEKFVLGLHNH